jgi:DUF917 family protein
MPTVLSDPQAIDDFVTGLAFLGTGGGGGRLEDGIELLVPLVKGGQPIVLVSPDELPDDTWIVHYRVLEVATRTRRHPRPNWPSMA